MYDLKDEEIEELSNLIEKIEKFTGKWVEVKPGIPYAFLNELASEAMHFLYDKKLIIKFDWTKWNEGKEFFKNNDPKKYINLDREFILKLLFAISRQNRFCDGVWGNLFESGTGLLLYKKLLETYK